MRVPVTGKRMREIEMVVTTNFEAYTKSKKRCVQLDRVSEMERNVFHVRHQT